MQTFIFTYNRQSVAQRQYNFLHLIICGNQIIESLYPDGLQVCAMRLFFKNVPVPLLGIVGNDITAVRKRANTIS